MPSHAIHSKHARIFLKNQGVIPDLHRVRFVDLLIDDPEKYASRVLELMETDDKIRLCIYRELLNQTILLQVLPQLGHDLRTQRYSPKKTGWSRNMIPFLRKLVKCVCGEDYMLLVDLHVFLDMAEKWCCDDELLEDWAQDVGIDHKILEYYKENRKIIDYDLRCTIRLKQGKCRKRNLARMLRFNQI